MCTSSSNTVHEALPSSSTYRKVDSAARKTLAWWPSCSHNCNMKWCYLKTSQKKYVLPLDWLYFWTNCFATCDGTLDIVSQHKWFMSPFPVCFFWFGLILFQRCWPRCGLRGPRFFFAGVQYYHCISARTQNLLFPVYTAKEEGKAIFFLNNFTFFYWSL